MNAVYKIKSKLKAKAVKLRASADNYYFGAGMDDTYRGMIRKANRLESIVSIL